MGTYVAISAETMEKFVKARGMTGQYLMGQEIVYTLGTLEESCTIHLYSSLSNGAQVARGRGADAIRLVLMDDISGKPISKTKRVNRTTSEKAILSRISERLDNLRFESRGIKRCPKCNSVLVKRINKNNKQEFWGCLSWPNCGKAKEEEHSLEDVKESNDYAPAIPKNHEDKFGWTEKDHLVVQRKNGVAKECEDWVPTNGFPYLKFGIEKFNPIQARCLEWVDEDCNVVIAASTSSGKTICAELFISKALHDEKKSIFLSPLKAVTQEKNDDWTSNKHPFSQRKVSIVTGDYKLTDARKSELTRAEIICMTSEMLDSRTRRMAVEKNQWLYDVGCLVVDEAHLITMEGRGDALECGISRFTKQNPHSKVILMSATMPNIEELAGWVSSLNGKPTMVLVSDWRPVDLEIEYVPVPVSPRARYNEKKFARIGATVDLVNSHPEDKWIVFVHDKGTGRIIKEMFEKYGTKTEFHLADLDLKERLRLDREFRSENGSIRVLISTSGLAYGINMPARRVAVVGTVRGLNYVDAIDIKQEVGRAGRYGLDDKGNSYVVIEDNGTGEYQAEIRRCQNIRPITSLMLNQDALEFHVVAEIEQRNIRDADSLVRWHKRTLAHFQGQILNLEDAQSLLDDMVEIKILEEIGGLYQVTGLGRTAAWYYYAPRDVAGWYKNINLLSSKGAIDDDLGLAWAISSVPMFDLGYKTKDVEDASFGFVQKLWDAHRIDARDGIMGSFAAAYMLLSEANDYPVALNNFRRGIQYDGERVCEAIATMDKMMANWDCKNLWDELKVRLRYGIRKELIPLTHLPGIGASRARHLFNKGIKEPKDIRGSQAARKILGQKVYEKVLKVI